MAQSSMFPEPTPLEAFASIDKLYHEAVQKERKAARANDRRVSRFWSEEAARLRELRASVCLQSP